jgi:cbb3-type cytochrome oxidase maturation protein
MDVVIGLVFVSLVLVALGLVFFFMRLREGDFDHGERLSLLPLREDRLQGAAPPARQTTAETAIDVDPGHDKEGGFSNGSG